MAISRRGALFFRSTAIAVVLGLICYLLADIKCYRPSLSGVLVSLVVFFGARHICRALRAVLSENPAALPSESECWSQGDEIWICVLLGLHVVPWDRGLRRPLRVPHPGNTLSSTRGRILLVPFAARMGLLLPHIRAKRRRNEALTRRWTRHVKDKVSRLQDAAVGVRAAQLNRYATSR